MEELLSIMVKISEKNILLKELRNEKREKDKILIVQITNKLKLMDLDSYVFNTDYWDEDQQRTFDVSFTWDGSKFLHTFDGDRETTKPILSETVETRAFFVRMLPKVLNSIFDSVVADHHKLFRELSSEFDLTM